MSDQKKRSSKTGKTPRPRKKAAPKEQEDSDFFRAAEREHDGWGPIVKREPASEPSDD